MRKDEQLQEKLFKRFKSGEGNALYDLLESERPRVYDYLMRMTSQISRSAECINEVYESLAEDVMDVVEHAHDLRLVIYSTARRFNADIWNAETSRLGNAALASSQSDGKTSSQAGAEDSKARTAQVLDKALRSLPGPEREVVWLHIIGGFTFEEVAQIVGVDEHGVESLFLRGVGTIDAEAEESCGPAQTSLLNLPPHPLPAASSNATVNLSMVMAGIKTKPAGLRSLTRTIVISVLIAVVAAFYLSPVVHTAMVGWMPFLAKF